MALISLILIPLAAGVMAWLIGRRRPALARWVSLAALVIELALVVSFVSAAGPAPLVPSAALAGQFSWWLETNLPWIPMFGIRFHLALDGLSFLLVLLTVVLGIVAVGSSWTEIKDRVGFFHFNLMWILGGTIGVFLALDLFLFYFFWEVMLVPMYFLISVWGHERRTYAAIKFLLFTQASGLLMFVAILALFFIHGRATGVYTFDYVQLLGAKMGPAVAMWLMLGFFVAFAVKVPVVPFHTWLPDAHTEAPTAGSVILAGLLLKTGAYGLLRFVLPLFPDAAAAFAPVGMLLGLVGIFYGAVLAFAQTDLKRLVAYTSISHMGFVVLGIFSWREIALQGAVMQMLCHGLSTGALFVLVGALQERIHTRDLARMGGLWSAAPRMGAMALFFALASLGLPGFGNFVGEFLVLVGSFQASPWIAAVAALGMVTAVIYSLWLIQAAFHGPNKRGWRIPDLSAREMAILLTMAALLLWLGLYPQPVFNAVAPTVKILSKDARARTNALSTDHMPVAALSAKPRPTNRTSGRGRIAP